MAIYADCDANGNVTAFYSDDIHETVPKTAIQITFEQWQNCLSNQHLGLYKVVNGVLTKAQDNEVLPKVKQLKISEIQSQCDTTISNGFSSSASGVTCKYAFDVEQRSNFNAQINLLSLDSTITSISWPTLDNGIVTLTREQFIQLFKDSQNFKTNRQATAEQHKTDVNNATTIAQVNAIAIQ